MPIVHLTLTNHFDYNPVPFSFVDPITSLPVVGTLIGNETQDFTFLVANGLYDFQAIVDGTPVPSTVEPDCELYGDQLIASSHLCDQVCDDAGGHGPFYSVVVTHPGSLDDPRIVVQFQNAGGIFELCGGESTEWGDCVIDGDPCADRTVLVNVDGTFHNVTFLGSDCCDVGCPDNEIQGLTECFDEVTLGDGGDLRVLVMTRGGGLVLAELTPTEGNFTRILDDTSTLDMKGSVTGSFGDLCCDEWGEVHAWSTEILVYRDGRDAWCGPVTDVSFNYGGVSVAADDLTAWWDRRILPDLDFQDKDLSDIFQAIHEAAMKPDPSPNISITVEKSGVVGTRTTKANQYVYASDILKELGKTGLDYTAYGRNVMVHGEELDIEPFFTLLDEHWTEPPTVRERGNDQATQVVVKGTGVQSVKTAPQAYLDYYGLLVRTFDESTIKDQASCDRAAQTRLDMLKDPLYIETPLGARLKNTAPITLEQLIPGMLIRVNTQSTCRKVISDFRLQKVVVDFKGDVSIDLIPLGFSSDTPTV